MEERVIGLFHTPYKATEKKARNFVEQRIDVDHYPWIDLNETEGGVIQKAVESRPNQIGQWLTKMLSLVKKKSLLFGILELVFRFNQRYH